jgi:hypothetical protein
MIVTGDCSNKTASSKKGIKKDKPSDYLQKKLLL